jgi:hypothetical protein
MATWTLVMRMMALSAVQAIYRLCTCVRTLFHIGVDADAYLPCLLNMNLGVHL